MSKRKIENRHIRNIIKHSGSYSVTLPIDIVRKYKWKERQKVEVLEYGKDKIVIKDWKK